ncbi:MAG: MFS transporter [Phycisphaerae bacterium]|nr:MFS transporter [Phycisphaerae bacterium]
MSWRSKTYDELPALSVRGPELRRNMRIVTVAWMYGVVWFAIVNSSPVQVFAKTIGFSSLEFGLMAAIPFVATFTQLLAAVIIERTGLRKYQFIHCGTIHRLMWIPIPIVALILPWGEKLTIYLILGLLLLSWLLESIARPAWLTWMGDLIPRRIRGRYFAFRTRMSQLVMIITIVVIGLLLDHNWKIVSTVAGWVGQHMPPVDQASDDAKTRVTMYVVCGLFMVAALFGVRDIIGFRRVRDVLPPRKTPAPIAPQRRFFPYLKYMLYDPLKERVFRHYVAYAATMAMSITFSGMFFWQHSMNHGQGLGFNQLAVNLLFMVIPPLADMAASPVWGRLIDRFGRRPILMIATVGASLSLLPWLFVRPDTPCPGFVAWIVEAVAGEIDPAWPVGAYFYVACAWVVSGASWSGVNLAQLGVMLSFSDGQGRSRMVAAGGVLVAMFGALGGYLGGVAAQVFGDGKHILLDYGPMLWTSFHITFIVSIVVRLLAIVWLIGMPDPHARSVRALLSAFNNTVFNAVRSRAVLSLHVFGWGKSAEDKNESEDSDGQKDEPEKPPRDDQPPGGARDRGQD